MMQKLFFKALKKNGNSQKKINLCVQVTTAYNEKTCYHTTPEEKKYFQQRPHMILFLITIISYPDFYYF